MRITKEIIVLCWAVVFGALAALFILTPGLAAVGYSFGAVSIYCTLHGTFELDPKTGGNGVKAASSALSLLLGAALVVINHGDSGFGSLVWMGVAGVAGMSGVLGLVESVTLAVTERRWKAEQRKADAERQEAQARAEAAAQEKRHAEQLILDDLAEFLTDGKE